MIPSRWIQIAGRIAASVVFIAADVGLTAAENVAVNDWYGQAKQAIEEHNEQALVRLIDSLPNQTSQVLGEVPRLAVEADWTNVVKSILSKGLLLTNKSSSSTGRGVRVHPVVGLTATEVLAVASRSGKTNIVTLLLNASTDVQGPIQQGSPESTPLLNAIQAPTNSRFQIIMERPRQFGSREDRRICIDLLRAAGATLLPTNSPVRSMYQGEPRTLASIWPQLDPVLLDYTLTNERPVTRRDYRGRGLLHLTIECRRPSLVTTLLDSGVPADQVDAEGQTPLHLLAAIGGIEPPASTNSSAGAPSLAARYGFDSAPELFGTNRMVLASLLLKAGARHDVFSSAGLDDTNALSQVLKEDPEAVRRTNWHGQTALHWAVQNFSVGAVGLLLTAGADPDARDRTGSTPMHRALFGQPSKVLNLLLKSRASMDLTNDLGETPMMLAMRFPAILKEVLQSRRDRVSSSAQPSLFISAIDALAAKEVMQMLFEAGERLDPTGPDGQPLIFWMLRQPIVTGSLLFLADKGLDVRARDSQGNTALHVVADRLGDDVYMNPDFMIQTRARFGNGESLRRFQSSMKRIAARTGRTPRPLAETRPLLDVLLELGVDAAATNHAGQTVLQLYLQSIGKTDTFANRSQRSGALGDQELNIIQLLKDKGVSTDTSDKWGMTPFLDAVRNHKYGVALRLLEQGADGKATNAFGETAFHLLTQGRWQPQELETPAELKSLIRKLLDQGLDPNSRNIHGLTAPEEMAWNREESRLEYYSQGDHPQGSRWPLAEAIERLQPLEIEHSTSPKVTTADYTSGVPKDLLNVFTGPRSEVALNKLMQSGARLDFPAPDGSPLIHWIVDGSLRLDLLPILALIGLDVNARDANGRTVLETEVKRLGNSVHISTDPQVLKMLAAKSRAADQALAWLREPGNSGNYVSRTNLILFDVLQKIGVAVGSTNRWGQTVLHRLEVQSADNVAPLIKPGVLLEARDRRGMTPFLSAVRNRKYSVALAMLNAGANGLATNRIGETAFHLVSYRPAELQGASIEPDLEELLQVLIRQQLDPRRRNLMGLTALEHARITFDREFAQARRGFDPSKPVILERLEKLESDKP